MLQHTQTIIHSEAENGDCWTTCIEAVLELPLGTLPRWPKPADPQNDGWTAYWTLIQGVLYHHHGQACVCVEGVLATEITPNGYHIVSGISPRHPGLGHAVVGYRGEMVWDPHPDRAGIVGAPAMLEFLVDASGWGADRWWYAGQPCPCGCGKGPAAKEGAP